MNAGCWPLTFTIVSMTTTLLSWLVGKVSSQRIIQCIYTFYMLSYGHTLNNNISCISGIMVVSKSARYMKTELESCLK